MYVCQPTLSLLLLGTEEVLRCVISHRSGESKVLRTGRVLHEFMVWLDVSIPNLLRALDVIIFGHGSPGIFELQYSVFLL